MIIKEETEGINRKIFKEYFGYKRLTAMLIDSVYSDKEKNNSLVASIRDKLKNLTD